MIARTLLPVWRYLKKWLDTLPASPGLIRRGQWRVRYPDGKRSMWFTYDCAQTYSGLYGGEIEYRPEFERVEAK